MGGPSIHRFNVGGSKRVVSGEGGWAGDTGTHRSAIFTYNYRRTRRYSVLLARIQKQQQKHSNIYHSEIKGRTEGMKEGRRKGRKERTLDLIQSTDLTTSLQDILGTEKQRKTTP